MKRIYTLIFDEDIPLSSRVIDDIKVICYLVYEDLRGYTDIHGNCVLLEKDIIYNELMESKSLDEYKHHFSFVDILNGHYEPFMVDESSFSFTVHDGMISEEEIQKLIMEEEKLIGFNYKFRIESITYEDDKHNKNRLNAIKKICNLRKSKNEKNNGLIKVLKPGIQAGHHLNT